MGKCTGSLIGNLLKIGHKQQWPRAPLNILLTFIALCPAASSAFAEFPASDEICSVLRLPGTEVVQVVLRLALVLIL
jgi:hypothetical protein